MVRKKIITICFAVVITAIAFYVVFTHTAVAPETREPTATFPIHESVRLISPQPNNYIESPFVLKGEARGNWYFEGSFPVSIIDANGNVLLSTFVMTEGDWMTTDFVPFEKEFDFDSPKTDTGTLILHKDNPSGLPEHDDEVRVPIRFKDIKDININKTKSGILVLVTIGPTCPVLRDPPDPDCADKPYQAAFKISKNSSLFSKTVSSGKDGVFSVELAPGDYVTTLEGQNAMPSMSPVEFSVTEGKITELKLSLDSGIR